ncbi:2-C-methyl-D-erythritol 4-phosphate cytidylyltransferase [Desulforamulus reducens MI-1]|uniref:2-C-methyl-D-erythritol 4-phosphate cytidylyltransferase n=1 Tax=Desulforamulus reducens (strain ATCC BAA-1160 / DSM 100696 / MI-1) TaxID=349161 RepID=ISPD_DESRM|nr:2-C-methyl-D-erythritol 4-phosphate cytidylyltransferase [Desulforamulus reducens]A4J0Y3.1 RecName: Full=2-C-methyl-D-erythritol 4-phosphate cytidylyltransferase; AltName: Full=4-diphosphocytidyl-2C-methyl-D-erythritol synthase; AltName: Full=MEP cytidylyltransferase; Short=MCT [Desulforamulus reducens MI-1]ABO48736.1 2-C-methyl-D-erythritol 4-phosphate cytidylyltransferase [Desulforamulus reducens MI-1]
MGNIVAVIPAAGMGSRMGTEVKKQYLKLQDRPILAHTIDALEQVPDITGIVLVVSPGEETLCQELILKGNLFNKIMAVVPGGDHRQTSVYHGLCSLPGDTELVVIHDGARPLVQRAEISHIIKEARRVGAAALAVPVKDTVKLVNDQGYVIATPNREKLWAVQTPQVFNYELILKAHQDAREKGVYATDDCALVEALGQPVKLVQGSYENIKITTPEDMVMAQAFLKRRNCWCE